MMEKMVSKVRAKKTKSRERQAGKAGSEKRPFLQHGAMGFVILSLLWLIVMVVLHSDHLLYAELTWGFMMSALGEGVFLLVILFVVGLYLSISRSEIVHRNSRILLLSIIALIAIISAKALIFATNTSELDILRGIAPFLLPFAIAPLLAVILMDSAAAIAVGIWVSLVLTILGNWYIPLFFTGLLATVIAAQTARRIRKRMKIVRAGLVIGLFEITCVFGVTSMKWNSTDVRLVLWQAGACVASGLVSAIIVLIIFPLFEALFRITTDITLLELSDLGHPLLQRLAIEAPGTYHHSLVVANLAQAAAEEIDANSLQARVASYFHDVGKLTKPDFFAENIQRRDNPHDDLPPSMSTLVITSHVKEGLSLGILHKLPRPIMDVILEHHGTSLLSYFHHKATAQLEFELGKQEGAQTNGQAKVDESAFRYTGPRPSSRESAIICMADAVEAASRSMEKTSPSHIKNLVNEIINIRLEDGQLDECQLTLSELSKIKASFVFTLTNMLHGRIPYPKDENRDKQQAGALQGEQAENKKADSPRNGEGQSARQSK